uniref:Cyclin-dependent kinases regulatory subunit n=1 Tax=Rhizophora mucronata TaxID=61149 RepID=A0A2P2MF02_RHIMU
MTPTSTGMWFFLLKWPNCSRRIGFFLKCVDSISHPFNFFFFFVVVFFFWFTLFGCREINWLKGKYKLGSWYCFNSKRLLGLCVGRVGGVAAFVALHGRDHRIKVCSVCPCDSVT